MLADADWRMRVEGRFWPKVARLLDWDVCWLWKPMETAPTNRYGNFKLKSYVVARAHRVAYALYHGTSPGDLLVCHTCDNRHCVNPSHLFLGTVADNSADMVAKGRWRGADQSGERNGCAKLTDADAEKVRELILAGHTNVAIAARFGVTHQLISRIRRGRCRGDKPMGPKYESLKAARVPLKVAAVGVCHTDRAARSGGRVGRRLRRVVTGYRLRPLG